MAFNSIKHSFFIICQILIDWNCYLMRFLILCDSLKNSDIFLFCLIWCPAGIFKIFYCSMRIYLSCQVHEVDRINHGHSPFTIF